MLWGAGAEKAGEAMTAARKNNCFQSILEYWEQIKSVMEMKY